VVQSQNAVTMPYVAALPGRDLLKQRITALYDHPRTSTPFWEGSRWFATGTGGEVLDDAIALGLIGVTASVRGRPV
jgi:Prolyl oligopeptidase, N-terminal beta-propeller domain